MEHLGLPTYPVQFSVDYPERSQNRLSTLFRLIMIIPIIIVTAFIAGQTEDAETTFFLRRRDTLRGAAAAHPVPQEVPPVVVRLERGTSEVRESCDSVSPTPQG